MDQNPQETNQETNLETKPETQPSGNRPKLFIGLAVLALILILAGVFFVVRKKKQPAQPVVQKKEKPLVSAYPPGTKIENPTTVPADFPKEILTENLPFTHIDQINYPNGRESITLAYNSGKQLEEVKKLYEKSLSGLKWQLGTNSINADKTTAALTAEDGQNHSLTITIVATKEGSRVTLKYQR